MPVEAALEAASTEKLRRLRELGAGDVRRFASGARHAAPWLARAIASELGTDTGLRPDGVDPC